MQIVKKRKIGKGAGFMKQIELIVKGETGLHARPASVVVSKVTHFKSNITVRKGDKEANLKSLLGVLGLGVCQNDSITILIDGPDEEQALKSIVQLGKQFGLW